MFEAFTIEVFVSSNVLELLYYLGENRLHLVSPEFHAKITLDQRIIFHNVVMITTQNCLLHTNIIKSHITIRKNIVVLHMCKSLLTIRMNFTKCYTWIPGCHDVA